MTNIINVSIPPDPGFPGVDLNLERINIILGANGSGKSGLLQRLAANCEHYFGRAYTPVQIEGGRATNIPINVGLDLNSVDVFSNPKQAQRQYNESRRTALSARLQRTFTTLRAIEADEKAQHSDQVDAWTKGDQKIPCPTREIPPFERLARLFNDTFPLLQLEITENNQLYVRKDTAYYPVPLLSDGEKQVLILLADIVALTVGRSVFLIDEPELNLHPSLAERLWASIEEQYADSLFIYATHSLSFALRENVEHIFALGHGKVDLSVGNSSSLDLRPFLGSIPGIVRSKCSLFVEGEETSFDMPFYTWLLGKSGVGISALGGSEEVIAAASREGVWQQISNEITIRGVVDRDYKSTTPCENPNVVVLTLHEAESYLCHPDLVVAVNKSLGNTEHSCTREQIIDSLVNVAKDRLSYVVAQRLIRRATFNLRLSMTRAGLAKVQTIDGLRNLVVSMATEEAEKARSALDPETLDRMITEEAERCSHAIDTGDVDELLILFEGKRALAELYRLAGCGTPLGMLNAAIKHLRIDDFPHLKLLRESLLASFNNVASSTSKRMQYPKCPNRPSE